MRFWGGLRARRQEFRWRKFRARSQVRVLRNPLTRSRTLTIVRAETAASVFFAASPCPKYWPQRPEIHGAPDWIRAEMETQFASGPIAAPAGGVALFHDASVLAGGVVATADGRIIAESLTNTESDLCFGPFSRPRLREALQLNVRQMARQRSLPHGTHILLKQTYDRNYGHWLVECLPKLAWVAERFDISSCKVIVSRWDDGMMREVYADSLAAFGIARGQIVEVGYETAHIDHLIYPLPITLHPWAKAPRVVEILETIPDAVGRSTAAPRRVYVSRNLYGSRRLLNEAALLDVCRHHAFEIVYPEKMRFADQVRAFAGAEIIVGNCGAALTNLVFAPRGCTLFALTSEHMRGSFFWDLAALKGARYVDLHGTAVSGDRDATPLMDRDFTVDVARFSALLADLVAERASTGI